MKDRKTILKRKIGRYLKKDQISLSDEHKRLERPFLLKSRKSFAVANLLFKLSGQEDLKKKVNLASDFEAYDWVTVVSYYAMYSSALAALARIGYRSKSHAASIILLEYHYMDKSLESKDIHKLIKAYSISEELITKLIQTKVKRELAQYDATAAISKVMAESAIEDADEFITKIENILFKA